MDDFFGWLREQWNKLVGRVSSVITSLLNRVADWLQDVAETLRDPRTTEMVLLFTKRLVLLYTRKKFAKVSAIIAQRIENGELRARDRMAALYEELKDKKPKDELKMTEREREAVKDAQLALVVPS